MKIRKGGALVDVTGVNIQFDDLLRDVRSIGVYNGTSVDIVANFTSPLSLSASPEIVQGDRSGAGSVATNAVTATPLGGAAPFTYSWVNTLGNGTPVSPSMAKTTFSYSVGNGQVTSGMFACTVTDAQGSTATATITANFTSTSTGNTGGSGQEEL